MTPSALPPHSIRGVLVGGLVTAWAAVSATAWVGTAAAELSPAYARRTAVILGVMMLAIAVGVHRHHPFPRFGVANAVTTFRAAIVALIAALVGEATRPEFAIAAAVAGVAAMSLDGVDGWLARRSRLESDFGARFDMETDAFLIMALSMLVWQHGKAGVWIVLAGLLRYVFIAAGAMFSWLNAPLYPSFRRKALCVIQIAGLGLALLPSVPPPLSVRLSAALLATLVYSFLADTAWLWRRAH